MVIIPRISAQAMEVSVTLPKFIVSPPMPAMRMTATTKRFVKIYLLYHLKTAYGNEAVKSNANAAHYTVGYGGKKCNKRAEE